MFRENFDKFINEYRRLNYFEKQKIICLYLIVFFAFLLLVRDYVSPYRIVGDVDVDGYVSVSGEVDVDSINDTVDVRVKDY